MSMFLISPSERWGAEVHHCQVGGGGHYCIRKGNSPSHWCFKHPEHLKCGLLTLFHRQTWTLMITDSPHFPRDEPMFAWETSVRPSLGSCIIRERITSKSLNRMFIRRFLYDWLLVGAAMGSEIIQPGSVTERSHWLLEALWQPSYKPNSGKRKPTKPIWQ